jgi:hypothetical protein
MIEFLFVLETVFSAWLNFYLPGKRRFLHACNCDRKDWLFKINGIAEYYSFMQGYWKTQLKTENELCAE